MLVRYSTCIGETLRSTARERSSGSYVPGGPSDTSGLGW